MRSVLIVLLVFVISFVSTSSTLFSSSQIIESYKNSNILEVKQSYSKAIKALVPVYHIYPKSFTVNLKLGWLSYLNKSYRNSQFHYEKAIEAKPTSIEPLLGLSLPLMAQGRWSEVEQLMYRVLKIDYYNYYANMRLSIALRNNKQYKLAEQIDRKMLALLPANIDFLNELGANLYYKNSKTKADSVFSYVLTIDYNNPVARQFLAKIRAN